MDGYDDIQSARAKPISKSEQMAFATACLGGERRWEGSVRGLFGLIQRRFSIHSLGVIREGELCFSETICFDDGETQQREWRLVDAKGGLAVEGPDVEQIAPARLDNENAMTLIYKIKLGTFRFRYRDLFRLQEDGGVENIGYVSLGGIRVMTITAASSADPAMAA
ncbi:DUF3833 family protein [Hyphococcus sp.]|jgi:hypothetical protein|uniref:DUF3833 family protein n=1 Tax=Hyphococcus sp. TaxID=2038636 RepID=UPI003D0CE245